MWLDYIINPLGLDEIEVFWHIPPLVFAICKKMPQDFDGCKKAYAFGLSVCSPYVPLTEGQNFIGFEQIVM